jgi:uncharacterized protein (TIGR00661 family)
LKAKVYLSDEGFGHIVRQRAILEELVKLESALQVTIQTEGHYDFAVDNLPNHNAIRRFNNIRWHKKEDSSPDLQSIQEYYQNYSDISSNYLKEERDEADFDFTISDFVYEAFQLAEEKKRPSFGVAHFTWDWFFSKLYPRVISDPLFKYFTERANSAAALFFPPLTPSDNLAFYKKNAVSVPFIVRSNVDHRSWPSDGRFRILIMDSGAGLMKQSIRKALSNISSKEFIIGVTESGADSDVDVFRIPKDQLLVDYVKHSDLVVGRPGFNTLSECIAYRVPMLLLSESMNPEMDHNISELKKLRLGAFISKYDFENRLESFLSDFLKNEYQNLERSMNSHEFETNGAETVAKQILERL